MWSILPVLFIAIASALTSEPSDVSGLTTGDCVLPPYPDHGGYVVAGEEDAIPGQSFNAARVNFSCDAGYGVKGTGDILCYNGKWSHDIPTCVRFCTLNKHPSVEYTCIESQDNAHVTRECKDLEPHGVVVRPTCRQPNYYSPTGVLNYMHCVDGSWDYVAKCSPDCGVVSPQGEQLIIGGKSADRGELPWHAGIYSKLSTPYKQICGGSLITNTVVVSAAHCFWKSGLRAASEYAVAVGKLHRPWDSPKDTDAQKFDVSDIKVPTRFGGALSNFQDDIALVFLSGAVQYTVFVRPVCIDFDVQFDRKQLREGNLGKVSGWGADGEASKALKVVDVPYIDIEKCIKDSPPAFQEYITSDKFCAGDNNGPALCKSDSGGGLVFPNTERNVLRYYLRGIVSTAPQNENVCGADAFTTFTQITKHEVFINEHVTLNP